MVSTSLTNSCARRTFSIFSASVDVGILFILSILFAENLSPSLIESSFALYINSSAICLCGCCNLFVLSDCLIILSRYPFFICSTAFIIDFFPVIVPVFAADILLLTVDFAVASNALSILYVLATNAKPAVPLTVPFITPAVAFADIVATALTVPPPTIKYGISPRAEPM